MKTIIVICPDETCWKNFVLGIDKTHLKKSSSVKAETKDTEYFRITNPDRMAGMMGNAVIWATPSYLMSAKEYDGFKLHERTFKLRGGK